MIDTLLRRLALALLLIAVQTLVCNHIHLFGYATPLLTTLFLCPLPLNHGRTNTMLWAFLIGLAVDTLCATPGLTMGSLTLTAFLRKPLLQTLAPRDLPTDHHPTFRTMGRSRHTLFILLLVSTQVTAYVAMDSLAFLRPADLAITLLASLALSLILALAAESLRHG